MTTSAFFISILYNISVIIYPQKYKHLTPKDSMGQSIKGLMQFDTSTGEALIIYWEPYFDKSRKKRMQRSVVERTYVPYVAFVDKRSGAVFCEYISCSFSTAKANRITSHIESVQLNSIRRKHRMIRPI